MERFGVTVENAAQDDTGDSGNGEAPAVAAQYDAGDSGNGKAPAVAARGDAGDSKA